MKIIKQLPKTLEKYNYIFIGSGLSAAVIASQLASNNKILIIEKRNNIGGNIYDYDKNGILVHKYGPHIFHTNDEDVYKFIIKYTKFNNFKNIVNAQIGDKLIPLPINQVSLKTLFPNKADDFIKYLKAKFSNRDKVTVLELSTIDKYQEIFKEIYQRVFVSYTVKMWNKKVEELDVSVFSRVPIYLNSYEGYFTDKYEGMPINGFTSIIESLLKSNNIDVILNTNALEYFNFKNNEIYYKEAKLDKTLFSSAPIDEMFNFKFGELPYRSLNIAFETLNTKHLQKTAVVNYPEDPKMTRISEYKNFNPERHNEADTIISKEYPGQYDKKSKLFNEPYYPIPNDESRQKYNRYLELAKLTKNLELIGRLANYKYINMDQAIKEALEIVKKYK